MDLSEVLLRISISNELSGMTGRMAFKDSSVLDEKLIDETTLANLIAYKLGYKINDRMLIKLFIYLDTIAYVPFGSKGMHALDGILKDTNKNIDSVQFKIDKMITALEKNKAEISDELKSAVEKFCKNYAVSDFDLSDPISFAAAVRRLDDELVAASYGGKVIGMMRGKALEQIVEKMSTDVAEKGGTIKIEDYIPKEVKDSVLSDEHILYLKKITKI